MVISDSEEEVIQTCWRVNMRKFSDCLNEFILLTFFFKVYPQVTYEKNQCLNNSKRAFSISTKS